MTSYRIYAPAREELEDIWFYTFQTWGEKQANKYTHAMHDCFRKLADESLQWRKAPQDLSAPSGIKYKLYFYHYEHHCIFFRELKKKNIGIISVLHDAMDIPVRLSEDLRKIEQQDKPE